ADGLRTPAEVLGGAKGRWVEVPTLQDVFQLLLAQRTVDRAGSIRYHNWRVYDEERLAGTRASVWLAKETRTLTLAHEMRPVAQYAVTFAAAGTRGAGRQEVIEDLRELYAFPSPQPSPQPHLWDAATLSDLEWRRVYRLPSRAAVRHRLPSADAVQMP